MILAAHQRYLEDASSALQLELVAARSSGSAPIAVESGRRLNVDAVGASYRFSLLFDSAIPEGVPVYLEVSGRRWEAEVLQREGLSLLLLARRDRVGVLPEPLVPFAQLHADPWYLIEALKNAIDELQASSRLSSPTTALLDLLLGRPAPLPRAELVPIEGLNAEQSEAVGHCVASPLWFVWGPPGTGKTSTLGTVVERSIASGSSLLISAHSNVAVDAALIAAIRAGTKGKPGRIVRAGPAVLAEARASGMSTREIVFAKNPSLRRRLEELSKSFSTSSGHPLASLVERWRSTMSELREAEEQVLRGASVVFATLSKTVIAGAISKRKFHVAMVDEVSMAYPPQVLVAGSLATARLNVFGDFRQLPPIVQSEDPRAKQRLGVDVFTACGVDKVEGTGVTMLKEQFRMHPGIRKIVSDFAYRGMLRDAAHVQSQRAALAASEPFSGEPVVWLDVGAVGAKRFGDRYRRSWFNPVSAVCAVALAIQARATLERVVILTPYRTQARLVASLVNDAGIDAIDVGTIHRYQGSEAPAIVLDLVDGTGRDAGMPFRGTSGERLLTVGLSRAQGKLIVVGDATMPTTSLTRATVSVLTAVRQAKRAVMSMPTTVQAKGRFAVSLSAGIDATTRDLAAGRIVAAWLPDVIPPSLRHLDGAHAERWPSGHAAWLDRDGAVGIIATTNAGRMTSLLVDGASRFAEALADAITGSPLTRRGAARAGSHETPTRAARHDQCSRCSSGLVIPDEATRYAIELRCTTCHGSRRATQREISAWLRAVGPACPSCRSAMALRKSDYGPFFGCTDYPACDGLLPLDALCEAALHPDPPPPVARSIPVTPRKRTAPAVSIDRLLCSRCFLSKPSSQFKRGDVCIDCE